MQICFFQDKGAVSLMPLTITRPPELLRAGILTIAEKWERILAPETVSRILPEYMDGVYPTDIPNEARPVIWINGRYLPSGDTSELDFLKGMLPDLKEDEGWTISGTPVLFKVSGKRSADLIRSRTVPATGLKLKEAKSGRLLEQSWQIFAFNAEEIEADLSLIPGLRSATDTGEFPGVYIDKPQHVFLGSDVKIEPGTVINASGGPVYFGDNAHIMAGSLIRGPIAVCENAVLKMGAKIYDGTTVGPWCKIGGEVHNVVFQAYSNKSHDGFLGNSVIGEWCNFGADSNNSNMKNNYGNVRLHDWSTGKEYDTGLQFCGTIMGDHSKTAINTMLNTGTVCGVSANIFSGKFPDRMIKSFRWIGPDGTDMYRFDKAMEAAAKMMKRRNVELTAEYREMMSYIFERSQR